MNVSLDFSTVTGTFVHSAGIPAGQLVVLLLLLLLPLLQQECVTYVNTTVWLPVGARSLAERPPRGGPLQGTPASVTGLPVRLG